MDRLILRVFPALTGLFGIRPVLRAVEALDRLARRLGLQLPLAVARVRS